MRITDDQTHSRDRQNFFGSTLRVATGDDNFGVGVLAAHATDGRSRVVVCARSDGAGIENDDGGLRRIGRARQSALLELTFKSSPVRLRGSTAEVLYKKSRHGLMVPHTVAKSRGGG